MRPAPPSRTRSGVVAACVVLALGFGGLGLASVLTSNEKDATPSQLPAWQRAVGVPERRLAAAVSAYLGDQAKWRSGTLPAAAFVELVEGHRKDMAAAEASFGAAPVPVGLAGARARAVDAAGLYGEAARVQQLALVNTGSMADRLAASATRLQALADRTYDRARLIVDPQVFSRTDEGIEVRRPAPVTTAELGSRVASEAAALHALQQSATRLEQISARMAPEQTTGEEQS
jgi:hypothetical protein